MGMFGPTDETAVRNQAFAPMNQALQNVLRMRGLDQQAQYQTEHNRLLGQHYANEMVNQAAEREAKRATMKPSQQTYSAAHMLPLYLMISNKEKGYDYSKEWEPVTSLLNRHVADKAMSAGAVYDNILANPDIYKDAMTQAIVAQAAKDPKNAEKYRKKLQQLAEDDGTLIARTLLPEIHNERQNERSAIEAEKLKHKDTATAPLREFEMVTGISQDLRGTPEYRKAYLDWRRDAKQSITIHAPGSGSGNDRFRLENVTFKDGSTGMAKVDKSGNAFDPSTGENINALLGRKGIAKPKSAKEEFNEKILADLGIGGGKKTGDVASERAQAAAAIKQGKDPAKVKAKFKQRTGQDY